MESKPKVSHFKKTAIATCMALSVATGAAWANKLLVETRPAAVQTVKVKQEVKEQIRPLTVKELEKQEANTAKAKHEEPYGQPFNPFKHYWEILGAVVGLGFIIGYANDFYEKLEQRRYTSPLADLATGTLKTLAVAAAVAGVILVVATPVATFQWARDDPLIGGAAAMAMVFTTTPVGMFLGYWIADKIDNFGLGYSIGMGAAISVALTTLFIAPVIGEETLLGITWGAVGLGVAGACSFVGGCELKDRKDKKALRIQKANQYKESP